MKKVFVIAMTMMSFSAFAQVKSLRWEVKKTSWSSADEKIFQEFVRGIGQAKEKRLCSTTDNCIKNKVANPLFAAKNPAGFNIFSDCADLPFILRGYFAWMNNLPFSYPASVVKASAKETKSDIRYTTFGNKISQRKAVKTGDNVNTVLSAISNTISSAMFRVHPKNDVSGPNVYNDFYHVEITRESIVPGTVFYDPNGHILVVYEVADDGRIFMIDAHPDNSLTRAVYDEKKFIVSSPYYGAGFKNWRPFEVIGGMTQAKRNREIENFSTIQHYGNAQILTDAEWKQRKFILNGETMPFGDFVRRSLAKGNLKYEPVNELRESLRALCEDMKDRKSAVDDAIKTGIQKKPHPEKLPDNIYGTEGEWESYSTPSRDARLKAAILSIKENIVTFYNKYRAADPVIIYEGNDLVGDLKKVYGQESKNCSISYTNSKGGEVSLNMDQVIERAYALSFDPYHCIELRWGASGQELSSCGDNDNKRAWYNAQQSLRNTIERNYDLRMDKTLLELPNSGLGVKNPIDLSLKRTLESL
jgi:hypothetical protein